MVAWWPCSQRISICLDHFQRQGQQIGMILVYLKLGHPKIPWSITIRNHIPRKKVAILNHAGVYQCAPCSDRPHLDKLRSPATFDAQYLRIRSGQGPVGRCWVQGLLHRASSASCWLLNWCLLGLKLQLHGKFIVSQYVDGWIYPS